MQQITYFAVEAKRWESPHAVATLVLQASVKAKLKYKELEIMGDIDIAGVKFIRFRADTFSSEDILKGIEGRSLIQVVGTACQVTFTSGRKGTIPLERMLMMPCTGQSLKFRGPGLPFSERQCN
jgi:hypothetical protein